MTPEERSTNYTNKFQERNRNSKLRTLELRNIKRGMGFIPLNNHFFLSDGHHIDNDYVIFIPNTIHGRIRHKSTRPRSLIVINHVAWDFLESSVL